MPIGKVVFPSFVAACCSFTKRCSSLLGGKGGYPFPIEVARDRFADVIGVAFSVPLRLTVLKSFA